jgi:hypothetical protein
VKVPRWNNVASPRSGSSLAGAPSPVRRTLAAALAFANAPQICLRYGVCACIRLALLMLPQAGQGGGTKASACANRNEAQEEGGAHGVVQRLCSQGHTLAGVYRNSGSNSHSSSSSTSCSNIRTTVRGVACSPMSALLLQLPMTLSILLVRQHCSSKLSQQKNTIVTFPPPRYRFYQEDLRAGTQSRHYHHIQAHASHLA